jgi:CHAT domain-containing protein
VIVSPDGALHDLPFEALPFADGIVLARAPSAAVLATGDPPRPPRAAALVAAPPDTAGLGDLPAARDEVALLGRLVDGEVTTLAGDDATIARLAEVGLDRYAVLHFAGHAVLDPAMPLRSALVLAKGEGGDGRWRAADIYKRRLDADLVMLSACSTARGAPAGGEGVASLARAFTYAGARATISMLWDVDDRGSAAFAAALYPRLAAGAPIGEAVAGARRELRERGLPPRVWAAAVLSGAPARRVRISARVDGDAAANERSALIAVAALGAFAAFALAVRGWPRSRLAEQPRDRGLAPRRDASG